MIGIGKEHEWNKEADVVVVGYGFAGATAAITAKENNASVLLIEKAPEKYKGGNSRVSGNITFWVNDAEKAKTYFKAMAGPYMDGISEQMLESWAEGMHENRGWLEQLGADLHSMNWVEFPELPGSDCVQVLLNGKDGVGEARLWRVVESAVSLRRIGVEYDTRAVELIMENGECIGLFADHCGQRLAIKANKAVILTCGGFENNAIMTRQFVSGNPHIYPLGTPFNTGDGIRMCQEVGADLWHMANVSGPILSFKLPGVSTAMWLNLPHENSYIFVGADGKRFCKEGPPCIVSDCHGKVNHHRQWIQQPLPTPIYMIFDEKFRKAGSLGKTSSSWEHLNDNRYKWSDDNMAEVKKGWIKKSESLQNLAKQINLSPNALLSTIEHYNVEASMHEDHEWSRSENRVAPIECPPYYAMELTPAYVNTQGGPRRNHLAQVVTPNGKPIPRLYSAGELGSIYGYLYQAGGNIGECFAFGRIAGAEAAAEEPVGSAKS